MSDDGTLERPGERVTRAVMESAAGDLGEIRQVTPVVWQIHRDAEEFRERLTIWDNGDEYRGELSAYPLNHWSAQMDESPGTARTILTGGSVQEIVDKWWLEAAGDVFWSDEELSSELPERWQFEPFTERINQAAWKQARDNTKPTVGPLDLIGNNPLHVANPARDSNAIPEHAARQVTQARFDHGR